MLRSSAALSGGLMVKQWLRAAAEPLEFVHSHLLETAIVVGVVMLAIVVLLDMRGKG